MKTNLFSKVPILNFIVIIFCTLFTSTVFINCNKTVEPKREVSNEISLDTLILDMKHGQFLFFTISGEYILIKNHANYSKNSNFLSSSKFTKQNCSNCGPHLERWKFPGNPKDTLPMPAPPPRPNPFPIPDGMFANPGLK